MATSGSKSVTVTSWDTLKFSWEEESQSIANNTTTISWKLELIATGSGYISSTASKNWSVTVNGTKYSGTNKVGISNNSTKTLASDTTTIKHNSDGSKTFSYSFSQEFAITFSGGYVGTKSGSGSGTLDTIPRTSSVTATAANIGSNTKIIINRAASSFTHTLTYSFEGLTGTIATKTTGTNINWNIPTSFYAKIPNAKSGICTITCETFSGSTSIGTKTTTFRATAAESNCKPTLSPTVTDSNSATVDLTGDNNKLVKYKSNASVNCGAAARNGATLKSYKIVCGSKSITSSSGTINAVESGTFTFTVTDSRGYTTTQKVTKTLVDYVKLSCSFSGKLNTDGVLTYTAKGNYFNGTFGSVANTLTLQYRYKENGGNYGNWTTLTNSISGNTYNVTGTISGLDYQKVYVFQVRASDKLGTVTPSAKTITAKPVFDWSAQDFNFNVPVTMNNNGNSYNLLGLLHSMTTTYELDCTVTPGDNYTTCTAQAHLVGCNLRMGITMKRKAAITVGNVTNETVMTINVNHGGKLNNLYRVDFNSGTDGGAATFDVQASKVDDNNVNLTVTLCGTTTAADSWNAYFAMPCSIITKSYV